MSRRFLLMLAAILIFSDAITASAQTSPQPTPKVLWILREDVKAARASAHEELEAGYVRALQKANWPTLSLGVSSIAGPLDALFITGYESFAAMEKDQMAMQKNAELMKEFARLDAADAEFRTGQRTILATLREDLSYNLPANIPQMRYFQINTVRVRPGHNDEWVEARKILVEALKKANVPTGSAVFEVTAGMPNGTFLVFTPRKSLSEMDPNPDRTRAVNAALGEDNMKKRQKLISDSVMTSENTVYAFSPRMSYVSKEFAKAGGEDFWNPKPMTAMKPAPKRAGDKTSASKQR